MGQKSYYVFVQVIMEKSRLYLYSVIGWGGLAGWLGWPAPLHRHCLYESASSISLSHKRTSNDTNQPTEQAIHGTERDQLGSTPVVFESQLLQGKSFGKD